MIVGVIAAVAVLAAGILAATRLLGGDGGGDGVEIAFDLPPTEPGPTSDPSEEWSLDLDCEEVSCEIAADAERVYTVARDDDEVMAYDGSSGDEAWDDPYELDGDFDGELLLLGDVLVLDTSDDDSEPSVVALDTGDGEELWTVDGALSGLVDDDPVVAEGGFDEDEAVTRRIDRRTGDEVWEVDGFTGTCSPTVILASQDGDDVSRVAADDGDELWELDSDVVELACSEDAVATWSEEDEELTVLDAEDGEVVATTDIDDVESIGVFGRDVYLLADGELMRLRISGDTLEEVWSVDGPDSGSIELRAEGGILVLDFDRDRILVHSDADGERAGRVRSASRELTTSGIVLIDDEEVTAHAFADLDERWSVDIGEPVDTIAVGGDRMFVIAEDDLLAFR